MTIPKALTPTVPQHGGELDAAILRLKEKLSRAAGETEGSVRTGTLRIVRRTRRDTIHASVTEPVAALVVSGAKEARLFDTPVAYGQGAVFVCGVNVPDRFVLSGSRLEPFLALAVPISERTAERAIALLEAVREGRMRSPSFVLPHPSAFPKVFRVRLPYSRPTRSWSRRSSGFSIGSGNAGTRCTTHCANWRGWRYSYEF